jgi:DNA-binding transcriptional regulator YiaG
MDRHLTSIARNAYMREKPGDMSKLTPNKLARGARYKKAREDAGLTQQEVAGLLAKDKQTISRWDTGASKPRDSEAVATLYGTNAAWLDYGSGVPAGQDPPYEAWASFIATAQLEPWQHALLRTLRFPPGIVPEPETYERFVFGLRSVKIEQSAPPLVRKTT